MLLINKDHKFASKLEANENNIKVINETLDFLQKNSQNFTVVPPSEKNNYWLFKFNSNSKLHEYKVASDIESKSGDEMLMEDALDAMSKHIVPEQKSPKISYLKMLAAVAGLVTLAHKTSGMSNNMLFSSIGRNSFDTSNSNSLDRVLAAQDPAIFPIDYNTSVQSAMNFTDSNQTTNLNSVEYVPDKFMVVVNTKKLKGRTKPIKGKKLGAIEKDDTEIYTLTQKELEELNKDNKSAIESTSQVSVVYLDPIENLRDGRTLATKADEDESLDFLDEVPMSGSVESEQKVPAIPAIIYVLDTGGTPEINEFGKRIQKPISFVGDDGIDRARHGTHVASSAVGNKFGVSKNSLIQSMKVMNDNGRGTSESIVAGIMGSIKDYQQRIRSGQKCKPIMNLSLSGTPEPAYKAAVKAAVDAGFLVVFSAGNSGSNACNYLGGSVSNLPGVVVVGNIELQGARWPASNYGKCVTFWQNGVSVEALTGPGVSGSMSGTSMAAPRVAGVLARIWEDNPTLTATQVINEAYKNKVTFQKPPYWYFTEGNKNGDTFQPIFDPKTVPLLPQQQLSKIKLNLQPAAPGYFNMPLQMSFPDLGVGQTVTTSFYVSKTNKNKSVGSLLELVFASSRFPQTYDVGTFKDIPLSDRDRDLVIASCPVDIKAAGDYWVRLIRTDVNDYKCEYGPGSDPGVGAKEAILQGIFPPSTPLNTAATKQRNNFNSIGMRAAANEHVNVSNIKIEVTGKAPTNKPTEKKKKKKKKKKKNG